MRARIKELENEVALLKGQLTASRGQQRVIQRTMSRMASVGPQKLQEAFSNSYSPPTASRMRGSSYAYPKQKPKVDFVKRSRVSFATTSLSTSTPVHTDIATTSLLNDEKPAPDKDPNLNGIPEQIDVADKEDFQWEAEELVKAVSNIRDMEKDDFISIKEDEEDLKLTQEISELNGKL